MIAKRSSSTFVGLYYGILKRINSILRDLFSHEIANFFSFLRI